MQRTIAVLAAAILTAGVLVPVADASWKTRGSNEPDTIYDVTEGLMFLDPDQQEAGHKVYFNVWAKANSLWGQYNANVAATGSAMQSASTGFTAFLGIWKDCNKDGYIGLAESAAYEYRAELLLDDSVCGKQTVAGGQNCNGPNRPACPVPYPHNDGAWIREFLFIGTSGTDGGKNDGTNPTVFVADGTRVWGDWDLEGDDVRTTCSTGGNFDPRTTGGMLDYVDCLAGYTIIPALNEAQDETGLPVGGWNRADPEESENTLNQDNPVYQALYGDDMDEFGGILGRDDPDDTRGDGPANDDARQAVYLWDCGDGSFDPSTDVQPTDSWYESVNESYSVLRNGECEKQGSEGLYGTYYPHLAGRTDAEEGVTGKREAEHPFIFTHGNRKVGNGMGPLGPFAPADLGLGVERDLDAIGPAWRNNYGWLTGLQLISRGNVIAGEMPFANANYMTFYARVGNAVTTAGFQLPGEGTSFTYGAANCGNNIGPGQPVLNTWNCDPAVWDAYCHLNDRDPTMECMKVGDQYHLKDIDCWDGTVARGVPVYTSTTFLDEGGPCKRHADYQQPLDIEDLVD